MKRLTANSEDRFFVLFDRFAEQVGEPNSASIEFFLDGRILNRSQIIREAKLDKTKILEARKNFGGNVQTISVKLQTQDRRKVQTLKVVPTVKLVEMMKDFARNAELNLPEIKFSFDGEILDPESTAEDIYLDDGECVDVFV